MRWCSSALSQTVVTQILYELCCSVARGSLSLFETERARSHFIKRSIATTPAKKTTRLFALEIMSLSLWIDPVPFFPRFLFEDLRSSLFWTPKADIKTTDKELIITVELPGVQKDQLNVEVRTKARQTQCV
jgi:HSP20 family molecular chaperone IbpA